MEEACAYHELHAGGHTRQEIVARAAGITGGIMMSACKARLVLAIAASSAVSLARLAMQSCLTPH